MTKTRYTIEVDGLGAGAMTIETIGPECPAPRYTMAVRNFKWEGTREVIAAPQVDGDGDDPWRRFDAGPMQFSISGEASALMIGLAAEIVAQEYDDSGALRATTVRLRPIDAGAYPQFIKGRITREADLASGKATAPLTKAKRKTDK